MSSRSSRSEWLTFLTLGLIWGSSYLFIKIAVDDFGTFTLVALRLAVGAALLWTVLGFRRPPLPRQPRLYAHLFVMGLINITVPFLLITWAERTVGSALAAVLTALVPLLVAVLAPLFIYDEPLRLNALLGLAIGFAGVIVLTGPELGRSGSSLLSIAALLGSSLCYAGGAIYARRNVRGVDPLIPAVSQVTFAFVVTGAIALLLERPASSRPSVAAVIAILWLGLLGSGVAYLAFFRLLSRWGATRTTLVAYLLPVVGIVLGVLVLHELIHGQTIAGTMLIITGIVVVNGRHGRRTIFARKGGPGGATTLHALVLRE